MMNRLFTFLMSMLVISAGAYAQNDVRLSLVDSNSILDSVNFKGEISSWADFKAYDDGTNGDITAGDNTWSAIVSVPNDSTFEWGATNAFDGTWLIDGPNLVVVVDVNGDVSGDTLYTTTLAPSDSLDVTLTLVDENQDLTGVTFKGTFSGWGDVTAYDDGATGGDTAAGDYIFTSTIRMPVASHEWGASNANGDWLIVGPNRTFTINPDSTITGDVSYTVPKRGDSVNVTFRVDIANELPAAEGIFLSGNFVGWDFDSLVMTDNGSGQWSRTVRLTAGPYEYKFFNGPGGDPVGETANFDSLGCGASNGLGGYNRTFDNTGDSTDSSLPVWVWNTCNSVNATGIADDLNKNGDFRIFPNPFTASTRIEFNNDDRKSYDLTMTNLNGQVVRRISNITDSHVQINRETLSGGLYFISLTNQNGDVFSAKVIIE